MRRLAKHALIALTGLLSAFAHAELPVVDGLEPLLIAAIREGSAAGAYDTPESGAFFAREFGTRAPLEYRVNRLEFIDGRPGCAHLEVQASQRGVIDRNANERAAAPRDLALRWTLAYCESGPFDGERE